jgi:hypothetical protein|tara:strand:+ start:64 stop:177 length:114 start_codon:yes stop_codon:yes gene_type:complete
MIVKYRPEVDDSTAIVGGAVILYHCQITIFGNETLKC